MCLMLAGLRGIDEDIWKAARVDGIPMWKTYLFIVIPMMRPVFITTLVIIASGIVKLYDLVVAQTGGGPGNRLGSAGEIRLRVHVPGAEPRSGLRRVDDDACSAWRSSSCPGPISNSEGSDVSNPATLAAAVAGADAIARAEPRGARPRRTISRRNIILYGTLIVVAVYYLLPLYVMIVTSLKGMPEIRLGNIFSPPMEITFEPWVKAWAEACTGLNCDGLSPRLLELGAHHRALGDPLDRHRLGERLRARQLALQGRRRPSSPS